MTLVYKIEILKYFLFNKIKYICLGVGKLKKKFLRQKGQLVKSMYDECNEK